MKTVSLTRQMHSQCQKVVTKLIHFMVAIRTIWAVEPLIRVWKGFIGERNEIVSQRHHILHVEVVLVRAQLQLCSNRFYKGIFPQIRTVVKGMLGNFHGVSLGGLDLTDGTVVALLDEQRIHYGDADTILMQSRCHRFMISACGLHDYLVSSSKSRMASAICSRPISAYKYSFGRRATLSIGRWVAIMFFPLDTSIPTAFIYLPCVIGYGSRPFSHRSFYLLTEASAQYLHDGST